MRSAVEAFTFYDFLNVLLQKYLKKGVLHYRKTVQVRLLSIRPKKKNYTRVIYLAISILLVRNLTWNKTKNVEEKIIERKLLRMTYYINVVLL